MNPVAAMESIKRSKRINCVCGKLVEGEDDASSALRLLQPKSEKLPM